MEDIAILKFQVQVRKLTKQIAQVKRAMKEPPSVDSYSLDIAIFL